MKRIILAAVLASCYCSAVSAQAADGLYTGTIQTNVFQTGSEKPVKIKESMALFVQGNAVSFTSNNLSGEASGTTGQYHGFYTDGLPPVTLSLHFGKGYKSVKGQLRTGMETSPGAGTIKESSISLKRASLLNP